LLEKLLTSTSSKTEILAEPTLKGGGESSASDIPFASLIDDAVDGETINNFFENISVVSANYNATTKLKMLLLRTKDVAGFENVKSIDDLIKLANKHGLNLENLTISELDEDGGVSKKLDAIMSLDKEESEEKVKFFFMDKKNILTNNLLAKKVTKSSKVEDVKPIVELLKKLSDKTSKSDKILTKTIEKNEKVMDSEITTKIVKAKTDTIKDIGNSTIDTKEDIKKEQIENIKNPKTKNREEDTTNTKVVKAKIDKTDTIKDIGNSTIDTKEGIKNPKTVKTEYKKEAKIINIVADETIVAAKNSSKEEINSTSNSQAMSKTDELKSKIVLNGIAHNENKITKKALHGRASHSYKKEYNKTEISSRVKESDNEINNKEINNRLESINKSSSSSVTSEFLASLLSQKNEFSRAVKNKNIDEQIMPEAVKSASIENSIVSIGIAKSATRSLSQNLKKQMEEYKPPLMKASFNLNPGNLGKVEVMILTRGNRILVDVKSSQSVLHLLMQNNIDLKNSLSDVGFDDVNINFDMKEGGDGQDSNHNQEDRAESRNFQLDEDIDDEPEIKNLQITMRKYA
jgi:hypothetical protein